MVCAIFASVAYNWTFYYLLGLCIATRDLAPRPLAARGTAARARGSHGAEDRPEPARAARERERRLDGT